MKSILAAHSIPRHVEARSLRPFAALWFAFLALWLSACGGGGGGGDSPPAAQLAIVSQPANQSVLTGSPATFTVTANATAATSYRWQRFNAGNWTDIAGATNSSYTLTTDSTVNGQQFRVIVSDGSNAVTSAPATLTVTIAIVAASIQTEPQNVAVTEGTDASFTVGTGGTVPALRWQVSTDGTTWADVSGATSTTLVLSAVALTDSGKQYRAIASNSAGSATSRAAALTVTSRSSPPPTPALAITSQPTNQSALAGASATFSVIATGATSYQWQRFNAGTWADIAGATSASYTLTADPSVNGQQFRVIVSDGSNLVTSTPATLTVTIVVVAASIQTEPQNVAVTEGADAGFTVGAGGTAPTLRWQVSIDNGSNWADVVGATSSTLLLPAVTLADNGKQYRAIASNSAGTAISRAALLTVTQEFRVVTGGDACGSSCGGDGDGGGVGSGGDGGDGAGPGLSAMRQVTVTAYKPDGKVLGSAALSADYLVSLYPVTYRGPFILKFADDGSGNGEYYDESKRAWILLQGQVLHVMVPSLTHHVSANPISEAAYQWALKQYGSEAALSASAMEQANDLLMAQVNAKLPTAYQTNDITNYVTPISDTSGSGTLGNTRAGRYSAVMAALPIAGTRFNSSLDSPALAFTRQLVEDLKDDGLFNVSATVPAPTTAYDGSVTNQLSAGICSAIAVWGSPALPSQLVPQTAGGPVAGQMTLLAGSLGGRGNCDGWGANARFSTPRSVAVDTSGNVYVADLFNHTIRKISPAGAVVTLAGSAGQSGSADGTGAAARFDSPQAVTVDANGIVYVATNNTIRRITPEGVVTTLAGTARASGSTDATGAAARFGFPQALAADNSGNIFVADSLNHTIRKVTPAGVVTTFAGTAGSARFGCSGNLLDGPEGVAVDAAGNVYVSSNYSVVCKITAGGSMSQLADGNGSTDGFLNNPRGLAVDAAGNVYVADSFNEIVRKVSAGGVVTTLAGQKTTRGSADGAGSAARFRRPNSVAVDAAGYVYVADEENHTVRKITAAGVVSTLAGSASVPGSTDGTGAAAQFNGPAGSAVDAQGNIYLADTNNFTIRKVTPAGVVSTFAGTAGASGSVDGTGANARFRFTNNGDADPIGIAIDGGGNLYVADTGNYTIRKITPAGVVTTFAGTANASGNTNGTGAAARFSWPRGLAVDATGNVFVADSFNYTIRKITSAGVVTTWAGTTGVPGSLDGAGAAAQFDQPTGVAVDLAGNVYVADQGNQTIRKITPAAVVTTLAGTAKTPGSADGTGAAARFSYPVGVAVDASGTIYVADPGLEFTPGREARTVRKITPSGVVTTVVGRPGSAGNILGALPASLGKISSVGLVSSSRLVITSDNGVFLATFP